MGDELLWRAVNEMHERGEVLRATAVGWWRSPPRRITESWMISPGGTAYVRAFLGDRSLTFVRLLPSGAPDDRPSMSHVTDIDQIHGFELRDLEGQEYELWVRDPAAGGRTERSYLLFGVENRAGARLAWLLALVVGEREIQEWTKIWRDKRWIGSDETASWPAVECISDGEGNVSSFAGGGHTWLCTDRAFRILKMRKDEQGRSENEPWLTLPFDDPTWGLEYSHFGQVRNIVVTRGGEVLHRGSIHTTEKLVLADLKEMHRRRSPTKSPPRDLLGERYGDLPPVSA